MACQHYKELSPHGWVVVGSYPSLTRASTDLCGQAQIGRRNGQQIGREVCSLLFSGVRFLCPS